MSIIEYLSILSNLLNSDRRLIMTHFHPIGARRVFPCWDEPAYKASFNISIKHFDYYKALSNMPARKIEKDTKIIKGKDIRTMTWTHFHQTPEISTYLVAIMLSESPCTAETAKSLKYYTLRSDLDKEFTEKVVRFVSVRLLIYLYMESNWTRRADQKSKVDHVAIPSFQHDGMENQGLIFYR